MTDEQFKILLKEMHAMRQSLYEVRHELAGLKLTMMRDRETATERHALIADWVMPARVRAQIDFIDGIELVDVPDDLKHIFRS